MGTTSGEGEGWAEDAREVRKLLGAAALELSGEQGFRNLTVEAILSRTDCGEASFYENFDSAQACYEHGYETTARGLADDLLSLSFRERSWRAGMSSALLALAGFLEVEPSTARGLLLEVHVAQGAAAVARDEVFERLSRAIDTARRENESRHSPPPIAARFILSAIDTAASMHLREGRPEGFRRSIPALVYIAVTLYFGRSAADADPSGSGV